MYNNRIENKLLIVATQKTKVFNREEKLMRKSLSVYFILLGCATLLAAGCAGEKSALKNEPAPVAAKESPVTTETPAVKATAAKTAEPVAPSVTEPVAVTAP